MNKKEEKLYKSIEESLKAFFEAGFDEDATVKDWLDWLGKKEYPIIVPSDEPNSPILKESREDPFSGEFISSLEYLLKKAFNCFDLDIITPIPWWVEELLNDIDGTSGWEWQNIYVPETGALFIESADCDDYYDESRVIQDYVDKIMDRYTDPISFIDKYRDKLDPGDYEEVMSYEYDEDKLYNFFDTIIHY